MSAGPAARWVASSGYPAERAGRKPAAKHGDDGGRDHRRPFEPAVRVAVAEREPVLGNNDGDADGSENEGEAQAEGDEQAEAESDAAHANAAQQENEGGGAGNESAGDAEGDEAGGRDVFRRQVIVIMAVAVMMVVMVVMRPVVMMPVLANVPEALPKEPEAQADDGESAGDAEDGEDLFGGPEAGGEQGEQAEAENAEGMGEGDDGAEPGGVLPSAAGTDEVSGNDGFAVAGFEGVERAEAEGEGESGEQEMPGEFGLAEESGEGILALFGVAAAVAGGRGGLRNRLDDAGGGRAAVEGPTEAGAEIVGHLQAIVEGVDDEATREVAGGVAGVGDPGGGLFGDDDLLPAGAAGEVVVLVFELAGAGGQAEGSGDADNLHAVGAIADGDLGAFVEGGEFGAGGAETEIGDPGAHGVVGLGLVEAAPVAAEAIGRDLGEIEGVDHLDASRGDVEAGVVADAEIAQGMRRSQERGGAEEDERASVHYNELYVSRDEDRHNSP